MRHAAPGPRLVLASRSARRISLLSSLGLPFRVLELDYREKVPRLPPAETARLIAWRKAEEARRHLKRGLLLTADTLVSLGGRIYGKPRSRREARRMLARLSGRTHEVTTAVVMMDARSGCAVAGSASSRVTMRRSTPRQIADYVGTGEPMDKAGAYGVQGMGGRLVTKVRGDYFNVVGFPVILFDSLCRRFGLPIPRPRLRALLSSRPRFAR